MSEDQKAMETLLSASLEHAVWTAVIVALNHEQLALLLSALGEAYAQAATLAVYEVLGERGDVPLLETTQGIRDRMGEVSDAIHERAGRPA